MWERDHLEYQGLDGRILLNSSCKKLEGEAWTGLVWFRIGIDCCESGEFLE
jgi:hypothetical protein